MELNNIEHHDHATVSMKVILLVFAIVVVAALGWLVWQQNSNPVSSGGDTVKTTATKTTTTTKTADANAVACGDKAYAFDLTFGKLWTGYKIKEVKPTDAIVTCYITLPTTSTDPVWTAAAIDHDAKYASLMAISVYTPAQFTAASADANAPTKLDSNANYVWAWSQAQAIPTDLDAAYKDDKNLVATFKISQ